MLIGIHFLRHCEACEARRSNPVPPGEIASSAFGLLAMTANRDNGAL